MATCGTESGMINIRRLPLIQSIGCGDYMIVESDNGTSLLDFCNFVVGEGNVTFDDVLTQFRANSADWESTHTSVLANSAEWMFKVAVFDRSSEWNQAFTAVESNSGFWDETVLWGNHA